MFKLCFQLFFRTKDNTKKYNATTATWIIKPKLQQQRHEMINQKPRALKTRTTSARNLQHERPQHNAQALGNISTLLPNEKNSVSRFNDTFLLPFCHKFLNISLSHMLINFVVVKKDSDHI